MVGTIRRDDVIDEEDVLLNDNHVLAPDKKRIMHMNSYLLIISVSLNIFLAFFSIFTMTHRTQSPNQSSYESGFATDLGKSCIYRSSFFSSRDIHTEIYNNNLSCLKGGN